MIRFSSWSSGSISFRPMAKQDSVVKEAAYLMAARKQRGRKGLGTDGHFKGTSSAAHFLHQGPTSLFLPPF